MIALATRPAEPRPDMPLEKFFDATFYPCRLAFRSPKTARLYRATLHRVGHVMGEVPMLSDLTDIGLANILQALAAAGKADATVENTRRILMSMANFAWRKGFLAQPPEAPAVPFEVPDASSYSVAEIARILEATQSLAGRYGTIRRCDLWRAAILIFWFTGLRIGAVRALRCADFDSGKRTILSRKRNATKSCKAMTFLLPPFVCEAIENIMPPPARELLLCGISEMQSRRVLRELLEEARLPMGRRDLFHKFRRSVAQTVDNLGSNATAYLGHTNSAITQRHYLRPKPVDTTILLRVCEGPSPGPSAAPAALDFGTFTTYVG